MTPETRQCQNCQTSFTVTPDELGMYEKLEMPVPKICAHCRWQIHLGFWVFGKFRKGTSDLSGDSLITVLPEKTQYPVYSSKEWFSDAWDAMSFGQPFDPARSFFDQLHEVQVKVPRPHQVGRNNTNSDWCDDAWECKNCYLSRSMLKCEELMYSYRDVRVKNSSDMTYCYDSEKCYDLTYCWGCFNTRHAWNCQNIVNGSFLYDCRNVQDSFMCWNLRNKQYCIRNEQLTKEEYRTAMEKINLGSRKIVAGLRDEFEKNIQTHATHREHLNYKTIESTGNYLNNCRRCFNAFHWEESENCWNVLRGLKNRNVIDSGGSLGSELCGNIQNAMEGNYAVKTSSWVVQSRYSEYLDQCVDCEYCFGCVGLKKKKYCILNKQYSEEEYKSLREKIIEAMKREDSYGDFLSWSMTCGGYNMSSAQIYFPLTNEEAIAKGLPWDQVADVAADGISPSELPDDIADVKDEITTQALICPETHYRFNIAPRELEFYRMMKIPLPLLHSDARNLNRFKKLTVIDAYPYSCAYCSKEIQAYYPPAWGYQKIACEECYQREIS